MNYCLLVWTCSERAKFLLAMTNMNSRLKHSGGSYLHESHLPQTRFLTFLAGGGMGGYVKLVRD